jgi:hypothetical protein
MVLQFHGISSFGRKEVLQNFSIEFRLGIPVVI